MNNEEKNLLKVQLVLNYYKKDITDRYMRCIENIVLDNDVLNVLDERVYITTLDKYNKLQNNWNELKNYLEKQIIDSKPASSQQYYFNTIYKLMQELEQGSDSE